MDQKEIYLISYPFGMPGRFIEVLVKQFAQSSFIDVDFPNGDAPNFIHESGVIIPNNHDYTTDILLNTDIKFREKLWFRPYVVAEEKIPDWNQLYNKYSNLKNILITIDHRMYKRCLLDSFVKKNLISDNAEKWMNDILNNCLDESEPAWVWFSKSMHWPYRAGDSIPEEYNGKVYRLNLYDIIHNKEAVLDDLSIITNSSINSAITETYDNYLAAQVKLYPGFDDK